MKGRFNSQFGGQCSENVLLGGAFKAVDQHAALAARKNVARYNSSLYVFNPIRKVNHSDSLTTVVIVLAGVEKRQKFLRKSVTLTRSVRNCGTKN